MSVRFFRRRERGQALAETALFATMAVMTALALLSFIPVHRTRTAATSAAYACAQFLSQSPNPARAERNAREIAQRTLNAVWSATLGADYQVIVYPPSRPGQPGICVVRYRAPILFRGLLGSVSPSWSSEWFVSRSETWKARWR